MHVSEHQRRVLYEALETNLGSEPANVMMELIGPLANDDIARKSDITGIRGEIAELRVDMAEFRSEVRTEIAEFRSEIRAEVKAIMPRLITANIASMMGMAGLVIASAKFL